MIIVVIDPSGNFKEGKGTTGMCVLDNGTPLFLEDIKASDFSSAEEYWNGIINKIRQYEPDQLVFEGYRLYNNKKIAASAQANSELETPQLIGAIKLYCHIKSIPYHIQFATEVKTRWSDHVLVKKGIIESRNGRFYFNGEMTNDHKRDALRHGLHYWRYNREHSN